MDRVKVRKIGLALTLCFVLLLFFAILYGGIISPAAATSGDTVTAQNPPDTAVAAASPNAATTATTTTVEQPNRTDDIPRPQPSLKTPAQVEVSLPSGCHLVVLYENRNTAASLNIRRWIDTEPTLRQIADSTTRWEYCRTTDPQKFWAQYRRLVTWPDFDRKAPVVILTAPNGELIARAHGYCMPDSAEGLRDILLRGLARYQYEKPIVLVGPR